MPTAYQWISEYQEDEKQKLRVWLYSDKIFIELSENFKIEYEKTGEMTRVQCKNPKTITTVEGDYIQVFCDDLKEFLINRKSSLVLFKMSGDISDTGNTQIYECIVFALKSRSEKLQVMHIRLKIFSGRQQIALLPFIKPMDMMHIYFKFSNIDEVSSFLKIWNQGCRLKVTFKQSPVLTEDLVSVKRMLSYPSTFGGISLLNREPEVLSKERVIIFFKPFKPCSEDFWYRRITFYLENPSLLVSFAKFQLNRTFYIKEQINRLSLRCARSLEVFANPLLMRTILEKMNLFDIQCLRKISRDIRSCIDTLKPDPRIVEYSIKQIGSDIDNYPETIETTIRSRNLKRVWYRNREFLQYEYDWHVDDFVYCDGPLIERVANDFKINIEHQKSKMNELILDCNENMLELIGNVLRAKDTSLNCKELVMKVTREKDIMSILPYLDSVDIIRIDSIVNLYLNDVLNLDQWNNAFILEIAEKFDVNFTIEFENSLIDDSLYTSLPPYRRWSNFQSVWYFRRSEPDEYFQMTLEKRTLHCEEVYEDETPDDFLNALI
uniref:F-box domain-containing protein n=1 Tax=Caenorhabditis tropicalis TaxID=1561998 RepID=A0A1I7UDZ8_9PELO